MCQASADVPTGTNFDFLTNTRHQRLAPTLIDGLSVKTGDLPERGTGNRCGIWHHLW